MAFELETILPTGVVAKYWRIKQIVVDYSDGAVARVELALYADRQARVDGYDPLRCDVISLGDLGDMDEPSDDFRGLFYDALSATDQFSGAISV